MPPNGNHDRDSAPFQLLPHVLYLADTSVQVVLLDHLLDPAGHRFHVATREAAVGVQPLVDDGQAAGLLEKLFVEGC